MQKTENSTETYKVSPVYFLHIAKTAGTSFCSFLEAHYRSSEICPVCDLSQVLGGKLTPFEVARRPVNNIKDKGYQFIRGHMGYVPISLLEGEIRAVTILRDPVERTVSHYNGIMRNKRHWMRKLLPKAKMTIQEFLDFEPCRKLITNFQTRNIALDLRGWQSVDLGKLLAFEELDTALSGGELLDEAKERLDSFLFVGITEEFDESIKRLCNSIGWPHWERSHPLLLNVTPENSVKKADLSEKTIKLIEELTELDQNLYDYRSKIFYNKV